MANFFYLVVQPLLFGGAIIAVFMYCCQYLLSYIRDAVSKLLDSLKEPDQPKRSSK